MKILISGSTGLVGQALVEHVKRNGQEVVRLTRSDQGRKNEPKIVWSPSAAALSALPFEGFDAVVHLAGESIAAGRWTAAKKKQIKESRVVGTQKLAELLSQSARPPRVFISASAVGFYGDRGPELLTEQSAAGTGFLPEVCQEWEAASSRLAEKGVRVVHLRFGIILSPDGGALAKMLLPFRLGTGGKLGSGAQFMSWVGLDDVVQIIDFAMRMPALWGPVNVVSPNPVTNLEFTKTLGKVLYRPTVFSVPAMAARLTFGEMAQALLLSSTRVAPTKLIEAGYQFKQPELEACLKEILNR